MYNCSHCVIQVQKGTTVYNGMFDAFRKIYAAEGPSGLYKGFWVSSFQIVSRLIYFSTYEQTRHLLYTYNVKENHVRALVAGTAASVVGQVSIRSLNIKESGFICGQGLCTEPSRISCRYFLCVPIASAPKSLGEL